MTHVHIPDWTGSSHSAGNAGECVQWAPRHAAATGEYLLRDSKNPHGPHLVLTAHAFTGLVQLAKNDD
ncbi:DUF397 domain-containing protein [Streptomyces sp. JNUCC 64]